MGRGLVEPIDDMRVSNPPSNPELLDALAQSLVDHDYDLKHLMRLILNSEAYQRSSTVLAANERDTRFYSRYYPRRLMAEVLLDAISQVTNVPTEFKEVQFLGAVRQQTKEYPLGTRALQLYDSAVRSEFLTTFGRNSRDIVCECERSNTPSMVQVLHLANGDTINQKLRHKDSCVSRWLSGDEPFNAAELIQDAYLQTLARPPSPATLGTLKAMLDEVEPSQRKEAVEDLYWSLLTSREFLFQH